MAVPAQLSQSCCSQSWHLLRRRMATPRLFLPHQKLQTALWAPVGPQRLPHHQHQQWAPSQCLQSVPKACRAPVAGLLHPIGRQQHKLGQRCQVEQPLPLSQ